MPKGSEQFVELIRSDSRRESAGYSLTLTALGIPHQIIREGAQVVLLVRVEDFEAASRELVTYRQENQTTSKARSPRSIRSNGIAGAFIWSAVILIPYFLEHRFVFGLPLSEHGRTGGFAFHFEHLFRNTTSLTLHLGVEHLVGNLAFGALFAAAVCQHLGTGVGLLSILMAGSLGNFINALIQPEYQSSLGASTALFGAVGLLVGLPHRPRYEGDERPASRFVPLAAGLGLLGLLGMSGERTDVMAHISGFGVGLGLGLLAAKIPAKLLTTGWLPRWSGTIALAWLMLAWAIALRPWYQA